MIIHITYNNELNHSTFQQLQNKYNYIVLLMFQVQTKKIEMYALARVNWFTKDESDSLSQRKQ